MRRWLRVFNSTLLCMLVGVAACERSQDVAQSNLPPFTIRWIDEGANGRSRQGPSDADRVPDAKIERGQPGAAWLKRAGALDGPVVTESHVETGADGSPVVQFTLTPEGAERFADMTGPNLGHWLAFVLNGKIITRAFINGEMTGGQLQLSGYDTEDEAQALAAELLAATNRNRS